MVFIILKRKGRHSFLFRQAHVTFAQYLHLNIIQSMQRKYSLRKPTPFAVLKEIGEDCLAGLFTFYDFRSKYAHDKYKSNH